MRQLSDMHAWRAVEGSARGGRGGRRRRHRMEGARPHLCGKFIEEGGTKRVDRCCDGLAVGVQRWLDLVE